ncbi:MAG: NUDIX domain-containing protein [Candidatus Levyibacteriota bacterium]
MQEASTKNQKLKNIVLSAAALLIKDDKVLLVRHTQKAGHLTGIYGLPGGKVDESETEKDTAIRELKEETGLTGISFVDYPNNIYYAAIKRKQGVVNFSWHVFLCLKFSGEIKESEETIPEWVKTSDLDKYQLLANVKQTVEDAIKFFSDSNGLIKSSKIHNL